jgi:MoCo/4Fe-4S cofactor protein with predicted Tat translocation signal
MSIVENEQHSHSHADHDHNHQSESVENSGSPKYWQTLEEWREDKAFKEIAEKEFLTSPLIEDAVDESSSEGGWARREFLKLMGASLALTSFGCVRRPATLIVPYVQRPKDVVEGIANLYASTYADGSEVFGVVVTTREGRPIHVTGNKLHPTNNGGMSARAHAHLLSLYDPSRLTGPLRNLQNETKTNSDTVSTTYEKADAEISKQIKKGGVAFLTGSIVSPSLEKVIGDFSRATNAKKYTWEPLAHDQFVRGQELSYGTNLAPRLALDKAKLIVSINCDFLGTFLQPTQQMNLFSKGRKPGENMNRLVVFESISTLTGSNADSRYRIRPTHSVVVAMGLLHELLIKKQVSSGAADSSVLSLVKEYADAEETLGLGHGTLAKVASELWSNRGKSLVLGGYDIGSQIAANLLNSVLGNDGTTIDYRKSPNTGFQGSTRDLVNLVKAMNNGEVKTLIIHGTNPGYAAPVKSGFLEALRKVETVIYTGDRSDETGTHADYVLPDHHPMEGWGDTEGQKGVYAVQQPTIRPLYNTRSFGDTLISIGKAAGLSGFSSYETFHEVVKSQFESRLGRNWVTVLQEGVVDTASDERKSNDSGRSFRSSSLQFAKKKEQPSADLELVLYPTVGLKDGTLANVTWLQEFPDPVSKICWDNYLSLSPKIAEEKKLHEGQVAKLTVGDTTVSAPVHIQPGQDDHTIGLALGYGRTAAGAVGNGVGINGFKLAGLVDDETRFSGLSATLATTHQRVKLAGVQGHHTMMGRQIVVEATLEQFKKDPQSNIHRHKIFSAWSEHKYTGHKWGMSIDLSTCTGCSACVIACQSENNIPTVGKEYVTKGRIMQWIRIDRYYVGDEHNPDTVHMPILCQHCDNAPCETVCPVAATTHSPEGLNDMIYNRCVGTRYCANNCPYKVRRFNWFNYARMNPNLHAAPMNMQLNPEVTVRARGVMEKCSFCTHKIHQAKTKAKLEDRKLKDGDIVTACQASCPTNAIVFGDLNDPESAVSKALKDTRHYSLLEELNTRPAIQYASKIRNADKLKGEKHSEKGGHA